MLHKHCVCVFECVCAEAVCIGVGQGGDKGFPQALDGTN